MLVRVVCSGLGAQVMPEVAEGGRGLAGARGTRSGPAGRLERSKRTQRVGKLLLY